MMQVIFSLRVPWELTKFTEATPSVTIYDWCNFTTDFYQVRSPRKKELEAASRELLAINRRLGFVVESRATLGNDTKVFVMKCRHAVRGSVEEAMNKFGCMALYPFVFEQGWMHVRALATEEHRLAGLFARLGRMGELRVDAKTKVGMDLARQNFAIPTEALVGRLTPRQAESLLVAIDSGYYAVPRRTRFEDIAASLRSPRTTYEEHVRKAEGKIMNAVAPYLSLYFGRGKRSREE